MMAPVGARFGFAMFALVYEREIIAIFVCSFAKPANPGRVSFDMLPTMRAIDPDGTVVEDMEKEEIQSADQNEIGNPGEGEGRDEDGENNENGKNNAEILNRSESKPQSGDFGIHSDLL